MKKSLTIRKSSRRQIYHKRLDLDDDSTPHSSSLENSRDLMVEKQLSVEEQFTLGKRSRGFKEVISDIFTKPEEPKSALLRLNTLISGKDSTLKQSSPLSPVKPSKFSLAQPQVSEAQSSEERSVGSKSKTSKSKYSSASSSRSSSMSSVLLSSSESSTIVSEDGDVLRKGKENQMLKKFDQFYKENYETVQLQPVRDASQEKIWNVLWDDEADQIYLIVAKFDIPEVAKSNTPKDSQPPSVLSRQRSFRTSLQLSFQNLESRKRAQREQTANIRLSTDAFVRISFTLEFQIWKADLKSVMTRQDPISTKVILNKKAYPIRKMVPHELFQSYIQNQFQDYASPARTTRHLHFWTEEHQICTVMVSGGENSIEVKSFKEPTNKKETLMTFGQTLHYQQQGKVNEQVENYLIFNYYQQTTEKSNSQFQSGYLSELPIAEVGVLKQFLGIRVLPYRHLMNPFAKSNKILFPETYISFTDENLLMYYQNMEMSKIEPLFIQQVKDSSIYLILFPTGLLLHVSIGTLQIQAKVQLHLKKDETIVDVSYCLDEGQKNQCVWILDSKNQVWRFTNELDANSCNWNLSRVAMLDSLVHKRFFRPAMNFSSFKDTSLLLKLPCLKEYSNTETEFSFSFNITTSKGIMVCQPRTNYEMAPDDHEPGSQAVLQRRQEGKKINRIMVVWKKQPEALARLKESQQIVKHDRSLSFQAQQLKFNVLRSLNFQNTQNQFLQSLQKQSRFDNSSVDQFLRQSRDVIQIIFIGKANANDRAALPLTQEMGGKGVVLKFLVQRKRSLEVLYTSETSHIISPLRGSEVNTPQTLVEVKANFNRTLLVVKYGTSSNAAVCSYRAFKKGEDRAFVQSEDVNLMKALSGGRQLGFLIEKGFLLKELILTIMKSRDQPSHSPKNQAMFSQAPRGDTAVINNAFQIELKISSSILPKDLFDPRLRRDSVRQTYDCRIIIIGRILIKLNETMDEIEDLGSFAYDNQGYQFFSLLNKKQRKELQDFARDEADRVLCLGQVVTLEESSNYFYIVEPRKQKSTVFRINTVSLTCREIFQSQFKILKLVALEWKQQRKSIKDSIVVDQLWNSVQGNTRRQTIASGGLPSKDQIFMSQEMIFGYSHKNRDGVYLALISECPVHVQIEVIWDPVDLEESQEQQKGGMEFPPEETSHLTSDSSRRHADDLHKLNTSLKRKVLLTSKFSDLHRSEEVSTVPLFFIVLHSKDFRSIGSSVEWISRDKLLLAFKSEFYTLNLRSNEGFLAKGPFIYGIQQLNSSLFCTILKFRAGRRFDDDDQEAIERAASLRLDERLVTAQQCLMRMDLATLRKFAFLKSLQGSNEQRLLFFFTPQEELAGASIFSKLSSQYSTVLPYLERIDGDFIMKMNQQVRNVISYSDPFSRLKFGIRAVLEDSDEDDRAIRAKIQNGYEQFHGQNTQIHMYQADLSGLNAIDYAFQRNAIYCIKAFVETLLMLPNVGQFRNCFDKALLLMINRGIDVKELVSSQLFYPQIWAKAQVFSSEREPVMLPYVGDLSSLLRSDPEALFKEDTAEGSESEVSIRIKKKRYDIQQLLKEELFEMQFNYILMSEVEGDDKLEVARTLKDCTDIELFEQEAIQQIIDFKWNTYGRAFFLLKFYVYLVFLVFYYWDVEHEGPKGWSFYISKTVCSIVNLLFFLYELIQMKNDGAEYFTDTWNYLELGGALLYQSASAFELLQDEVSDVGRILNSLSMIMTLAKMVYLIRVFRQLNFLVTMLMTVVKEIFYFMILFILFLLTFAESYHILEVDMTVYGRVPPLMAYCIAVLRSAMGDFSIINITMGFDLIDDPSAEGDEKYRFSYFRMLFTFCVFILCSFFIFIIFMNFLIAVIAESYSKVIKNKEAFDYQQRASMINEREGYFTDQDLQNPNLFPAIIVIRKAKPNEEEAKNMKQMVGGLRTFFKQQIEKVQSRIRGHIDEAMKSMSSSVKVLEMDIHNITKDLEKVGKDLWTVLDANHAPNNDSSIYPDNNSEFGNVFSAQSIPKATRSVIREPKTTVKPITLLKKAESPSSSSISHEGSHSSKSLRIGTNEGAKAMTPLDQHKVLEGFSALAAKIDKIPTPVDTKQIRPSFSMVNGPNTVHPPTEQNRSNFSNHVYVPGPSLIKQATAQNPVRMPSKRKSSSVNRMGSPNRRSPLKKFRADNIPHYSNLRPPPSTVSAPPLDEQVIALITRLETKMQEIQSENRELRAMVSQMMEDQRETLKTTKDTNSKIAELGEEVKKMKEEPTPQAFDFKSKLEASESLDQQTLGINQQTWEVPPQIIGYIGSPPPITSRQASPRRLKKSKTNKRSKNLHDSTFDQSIPLGAPDVLNISQLKKKIWDQAQSRALLNQIEHPLGHWTHSLSLEKRVANPITAVDNFIKSNFDQSSLERRSYEKRSIDKRSLGKRSHERKGRRRSHKGKRDLLAQDLDFPPSQQVVMATNKPPDDGSSPRIMKRGRAEKKK